MKKKNAMWPFKSVKSLKESGFFQNFIDWHSHILPGVDDGVRTIEDSLKVLSVYETLGIEKVWLTPHIMEDYPNTPADLKVKFERLKDAWKGKVELRLAAENMLDSLFEERLESGDLLPLGDDGNYLLVETSYYTPPYGMDDILNKIKAKGYFPVLAHPERYRYMNESDYETLKGNDVLFQMNFASLVGAYGDTARKKAEWLLEHDMVNLSGSDLHNLSAMEGLIEQSPKKKIILERLVEISGKKI